MSSTRDGSRTLFSARYQQTYHSHFGAITEARQVFLQTSGVAQRLEEGMPTSILELGFGLGLNFLVTADLALSQNSSLFYTAFEHDLVSAEMYKALGYGQLLGNQALADSLLPVFEQTNKQASRSEHLSGRCCLMLHRADLAVSDFGPAPLFDAIYLDAFSPDSNPECWTPAVFQRLFACMKPGGTLTTYSVKGAVRRALSGAGFLIEKRPGPPGKREILRASAPMVA